MKEDKRREEMIRFSVKDRGLGLIIRGRPSVEFVPHKRLRSALAPCLTFPCGFWRGRGADVRAAGFGFLLLCLLRALLTGLEWTECGEEWTVRTAQ